MLFLPSSAEGFLFVCLCLFYFTTFGLFAILGRIYTIYHQLFPIISSSMVSGSYNRVFPFFPFIVFVLFSLHLDLYFINYGGWDGGSMSDMLAV